MNEELPTTENEDTKLCVKEDTLTNAHSVPPDGDKNFSNSQELEFIDNKYIRIFIGTWNLQGKCPSSADEISDFIKDTNEEPFHMYVIGTQECERSIEKSFLVSSKQNWENVLIDRIGEKYVVVKSVNMVAIHLIIFIRKELISYVSDLYTSSVITGFMNQIGNKGGISISFTFGETKLMFINCHFAANQENIEQRNANYHRIIQEIEYKGYKGGNLFDNFDSIFFFGDLNYRINGNRKVVDKCLETKLYDVLLANDQLSIEKKRGNIFKNFTEGEITFLPTYKFSDNSDEYDTSEKMRIPSYTDRILYFSKANVELLKYTSCPTVRLSDHRPVIAHFLVQVDIPSMKKTMVNQKWYKTENKSGVCNVM